MALLLRWRRWPKA